MGDVDILEDWIKAISPYRHIEDPMDLEVLMAAYWANITPGPKVWLILRSASGVGGSRNLELFKQFPDVVLIPSFTQAGFEELLKEIDRSYISNVPKTHLIVTDLTLMLTKAPETVDQLRLAYGGEYGRQKYGAPTYRQQRTFGFMGKATNQAMDRAAEWFAELGPRTLEHRLAEPPRPVVRPKTDEEDKLAEQEETYQWARKLIKEGYHERFKERFQKMKFGPKEELTKVVDLLRHARSNLPIHPTLHNLESPGDPEHFNRPYAQLERLLTAYAILKGHDEVEWDAVKKLAKKIAIDSIPGWRHRTIQVFQHFDGRPQHPLALRQGIGLSLDSKGVSEVTWKKLIEEMEMLGILEVDDDEVRLLPDWQKVLKEYKEEVPEAFRPPPDRDFEGALAEIYGTQPPGQPPIPIYGLDDQGKPIPRKKEVKEDD